jgi:hypothetical protein
MQVQKQRLQTMSPSLLGQHQISPLAITTSHECNHEDEWTDGMGPSSGSRAESMFFQCIMQGAFQSEPRPLDFGHLAPAWLIVKQPLMHRNVTLIVPKGKHSTSS